MQLAGSVVCIVWLVSLGHAQYPLKVERLI